MILKRITIENIRSYAGSTSIDIPIGTILFQGDVGCGKSSILSAIEFALFGLGDLDGKNLLRNGQKKGSVQLEFESSKRSYTIFRSLIKNSKNVVQDEGYIIEDGEKTHYSVSEIKARILEIINIKERTQTKTTSIIYRFAIFTPQEMMKQILTENQDRRLEILRRAFGIEEYSTIKNNIMEVGIPWLKVETKTAKELSVDLLEKQTMLDKQRKRIEQITEEITKVSYLLNDLEGRLNKLQSNLEGLQKKKEEVVRLEEFIPLLHNKIQTDQKRKSDAEADLVKLENDLEKIKTAEINVATLKPKYDNYLKKKMILMDLEKSVKMFSNLEKEKLKLENIIEGTKQRLEDEIRRLQTEIKESKVEIEGINDSIKILDELTRQKDSLEGKVKLLPHLRKQSQAISNKISEQNTNKGSLIKELEKKSIEINQIKEIGENAPCPKCKQKLTKEHMLAVISEFDIEKNHFHQEIRELENSLNFTIIEKRKVDEEINIIEQLDKKLIDINNRIAELEEKKKNLNKLKLKFHIKEELISQHATKFNKREYCELERKKLNELTQEMNHLSKDVESIQPVKDSIREYEYGGIESKYAESNQEVKRKGTVEKDIDKISKSMQKLGSSIGADINELTIKRLLLEKSRGVTDKITVLESEKKVDEEEKVKCKAQIASKQAELDMLNLHDLELEVLKKEKHFSNMLVYGQTYNWMDECFIPIVEDIEQYVLASINEEFNVMFQHWFNLLVDIDDITVEVDENFSPLITQAGYTMDVTSLSGGEKTSVALAYRLALNAMIKKTASFQSHLLILDEPTDGFSREQLMRLRYVLDELDSSQIIMVSHERELESFVSSIFRITKENGVSRLELVDDKI